MLKLSFQHGVLLSPLAPIAHVYERWPGFRRWVRQFASPAYSDREYIIAHAHTVAMALAAAILTSRFPHPAALFFAFSFALSLLERPLSHWLVK